MDYEVPEEILDQIRKWDYKNAFALFYLIKKLWAYPDYVKFSWEKNDLNKQDELTISISTVGYSENERIISALEDNHFLWTIFWYSSVRGGHFVFKINPIQLGYKKATEFSKEIGITKQAIYKSKHLYDWVEISQNRRYVRHKQTNNETT